MKKFGIALLFGLALLATPATALAEPLFATTTGGQLISFDSDNPGTILSNVAISGVNGSIVGIDFRPATGLTVLYGLGISNGAGTVYIINTTTGVATVVTPLTGVTFAAGARVSIDFNPVPDALRIVDSNGQNIRVTGFPAGGPFATIVDTPLTLNGATPNVIGVAYSNINIPQTAATFPNTLLALNNGGVGVDDRLYVLDPPNAGTLTTIVANLNLIPGFDVMQNSDIDSSIFTSTTYATLNGGLIAQFSPITGFSVQGNVGGGFNGQLTSIAVGASAIPEPGSLVLLGIGLVGLMGYVRHRRKSAA